MGDLVLEQSRVQKNIPISHRFVQPHETTTQIDMKTWHPERYAFTNTIDKVVTHLLYMWLHSVISYCLAVVGLSD